MGASASDSNSVEYSVCVCMSIKIDMGKHDRSVSLYVTVHVTFAKAYMDGD